MEIIGMILAVVGLIVIVAGGIWFLVTAFQESPAWGLGCLLCSPLQLVFLVTHWDKAGKPFLVQLAGAVPLFLGAMLMGPNA